MLSVAVPVMLFAGATVVAQAVSPSRGQPLLPSLPSISEVSLPHGLAAEVYLQSSQAGVNQFHLIFTRSDRTSGATETSPRVVASRLGGSTMPLRLVRLSPGHYIAFTVFDTGTWRFTVVGVIDGRSRSFSIERVLS